METPSSAGGGSTMYTPKAVPLQYHELVKASREGDLESVQAQWKPHMLSELLAMGPDETCHPLLHAVHHLKPNVVQFLCQCGLSPRQRGTVHPYTGDGLVVSELQGVSPMELVDRMLWHMATEGRRRSKKKLAAMKIQETLLSAAEQQRKRAETLRASLGLWSPLTREPEATDKIDKTTKESVAQNLQTALDKVATTDTDTETPCASPASSMTNEDEQESDMEMHTPHKASKHSAPVHAMSAPSRVSTYSRIESLNMEQSTKPEPTTQEGDRNVSKSSSDILPPSEPQETAEQIRSESNVATSTQDSETTMPPPAQTAKRPGRKRKHKQPQTTKTPTEYSFTEPLTEAELLELASMGPGSRFTPPPRPVLAIAWNSNKSGLMCSAKNVTWDNVHDTPDVQASTSPSMKVPLVELNSMEQDPTREQTPLSSHVLGLLWKSLEQSITKSNLVGELDLFLRQTTVSKAEQEEELPSPTVSWKDAVKWLESHARNSPWRDIVSIHRVENLEIASSATEATLDDVKTTGMPKTNDLTLFGSDSPWMPLINESSISKLIQKQSEMNKSSDAIRQIQRADAVGKLIPFNIRQRLLRPIRRRLARWTATDRKCLPAYQRSIETALIPHHVGEWPLHISILILSDIASTNTISTTNIANGLAGRVCLLIQSNAAVQRWAIQNAFETNRIFNFCTTMIQQDMTKQQQQMETTGRASDVATTDVVAVTRISDTFGTTTTNVVSATNISETSTVATDMPVTKISGSETESTQQESDRQNEAPLVQTAPSDSTVKHLSFASPERAPKRSRIGPATSEKGSILSVQSLQQSEILSPLTAMMYFADLLVTTALQKYRRKWMSQSDSLGRATWVIGPVFSHRSVRYMSSFQTKPKQPLFGDLLTCASESQASMLKSFKSLKEVVQYGELGTLVRTDASVALTPAKLSVAPEQIWMSLPHNICLEVKKRLDPTENVDVSIASPTCLSILQSLGTPTSYLFAWTDILLPIPIVQEENSKQLETKNETESSDSTKQSVQQSKQSTQRWRWSWVVAQADDAIASVEDRALPSSLNTVISMDDIEQDDRNDAALYGQRSDMCASGVRAGRTMSRSFLHILNVIKAIVGVTLIPPEGANFVVFAELCYPLPVSADAHDTKATAEVCAWMTALSKAIEHAVVRDAYNKAFGARLSPFSQDFTTLTSSTGVTNDYVRFTHQQAQSSSMYVAINVRICPIRANAVLADGSTISAIPQ